MIKSPNKYLFILGCCLVLLLYSEKVNGQFADNTIDESDCNLYCHAHCQQYFNSGSGEFSTCVSANVHCNCGYKNISRLPWYGLLIVAIGSLIVVAFCCVCLFSFTRKHRATRPQIGVVGGSYMNPFGPTSTILYSEQRNSAFDNSPPNGAMPYSYNHTIQPAFNPSYTDNASAPSFNVVSEFPSHISNSNDVPPSYNEAVKQNQ